MLAFFGLTPEYRVQVFSLIHDIVFHGNGGFDYHTVYNMPIWMRRFTAQKISEFNDKQNEEMKKASKGKSSTSSVPKGPAIKRPSYSTKARK